MWYAVKPFNEQKVPVDFIAMKIQKKTFYFKNSSTS